MHCARVRAWTQVLLAAAAKHGALRNQWMRHPYVAGYTPNPRDSLRSAVDVFFGFVAGIGSRDVVRVEAKQQQQPCCVGVCVGGVRDGVVVCVGAWVFGCAP